MTEIDQLQQRYGRVFDYSSLSSEQRKVLLDPGIAEHQQDDNLAVWIWDIKDAEFSSFPNLTVRDWTRDMDTRVQQYSAITKDEDPENKRIFILADNSELYVLFGHYDR